MNSPIVQLAAIVVAVAKKAADKVVNGKGLKIKGSWSDIGPGKEYYGCLVKITLPSKLEVKRKSSCCHIKVFVPWVTADCAADNILTI